MLKQPSISYARSFLSLYAKAFSNSRVMYDKHEQWLGQLEFYLWMSVTGLWMSVHCALTRKVMTLTLTINDDEEHKAFPMSLHILQCTDMQPFMDRYTWDFWLFFVLNPFKFERKSMYDNLFLVMGWKWSYIDIQL